MDHEVSSGVNGIPRQTLFGLELIVERITSDSSSTDGNRVKAHRPFQDLSMGKPHLPDLSGKYGGGSNLP
jgi:hypothetical protein